jgi:hypothetical protein
LIEANSSGKIQKAQSVRQLRLFGGFCHWIQDLRFTSEVNTVSIYNQLLEGFGLTA